MHKKNEPRAAVETREAQSLDGEHCHRNGAVCQATVPHDGTLLDAWRDGADDLAEWASERLRNRTDAYGAYSGRATSTQKREPTAAVLAKHFRGETIIGLHTTSTENTSKWLAFDIDCHGDGDDPDGNLRDAMALVQRLTDDGFEPVLEDSDGRGSFHVWTLFDRPVPTKRYNRKLWMTG